MGSWDVGRGRARRTAETPPYRELKKSRRLRIVNIVSVANGGMCNM
jgi:hypothetical protein